MDELTLVRTTVEDLPDRKAHIITRRFGLDGEPEATLQEVGDEIGLTRERVRQLEMESMDALRLGLEIRYGGRNGKC
jgi:RNA polymerase nonessential primary-like sigma factor